MQAYLNSIRNWSTRTRLVVSMLLLALGVSIIPAYAVVKVVLRDNGIYSTAGGRIVSSGSGWAVSGPLAASSTVTTTGNVLPSTNAGANLGSSSAAWGKAWVSQSLYSADWDAVSASKPQMQIGRTYGTLLTVNPMVDFIRTVKFSEYSNGPAGVATLNGSGWVTVANTMVDANTRIILTGQNTTGAPYVKSRVDNTSFSIYSTDSSDSGVVYWELRKN